MCCNLVKEVGDLVKELLNTMKAVNFQDSNTVVADALI